MSAAEFLTIEETADRLSVSVATARRMAADGRIQATKRGRQWLVDARTLPARRVQRRRTHLGLNIREALRHVKATDLSELLVPDILRFQDRLAPAAEPELLRLAESRFAGAPP